MSNSLRAALPYVNTKAAVLVTLAVNMLAAVIFWPGGCMGLGGLARDAFFCGLITSVVTTACVWRIMSGLARRGLLPVPPTESRLMRLLPRRAVPFAALCAALFTPLTVLLTTSICRFYGLERLDFDQFLLFKLIYSLILSAKIAEFAVYRYIQRDCRASALACPHEGIDPSAVKAPLPKIGYVLEALDSVVINLGFALIAGALLGGVEVRERVLLVLPTRLEFVYIPGLIMGCILALRIVPVTARKILLARRNEEVLCSPSTLSPLRRLPADPRLLTLCFVVALMPLTAFVFWFFMWFFDLAVLDLYRFALLQTVYGLLIAKPVTALVARRCLLSNCAPEKNGNLKPQQAAGIADPAGTCREGTHERVFQR